MINTPPVAGLGLIERNSTNGAAVPVATLLGNDMDADGDPIIFVGVSANSAQGGTVVSNSNWIYYTPAAGFTNGATFTYIISDGRGAPVSTTVTIAIRPDSGVPTTLSISNLGSGTYAIRGGGTSGRTYQIQFVENMSQTNWLSLGTVTTDTNGEFHFLTRW